MRCLRACVRTCAYQCVRAPLAARCKFFMSSARKGASKRAREKEGVGMSKRNETNDDDDDDEVAGISGMRCTKIAQKTKCKNLCRVHSRCLRRVLCALLIVAQSAAALLLLLPTNT